MFTTSHYKSSHQLTKNTASLPTLAASAPTLPACTDIREEEPSAAALPPDFSKIPGVTCHHSKVETWQKCGTVWHESAIAIQN